VRRTLLIDGWQTRPHASFFLEVIGAAQPWQPVVLPHDATLSGQRHPSHLVVGPPVHLALDGVVVTTERVDGAVALVQVTTTLVHDGRGLARRQVVTER
jgi:hypothetical protein